MILFSMPECETITSSDLSAKRISSARDMVHDALLVAKDMVHDALLVAKDMVHDALLVAKDMVHDALLVAKDMVHDALLVGETVNHVPSHVEYGSHTCVCMQAFWRGKGASLNSKMDWLFCTEVKRWLAGHHCVPRTAYTAIECPPPPPHLISCYIIWLLRFGVLLAIHCIVH